MCGWNTENKCFCLITTDVSNYFTFCCFCVVSDFYWFMKRVQHETGSTDTVLITVKTKQDIHAVHQFTVFVLFIFPCIVLVLLSCTIEMRVLLRDTLACKLEDNCLNLVNHSCCPPVLSVEAQVTEEHQQNHTSVWKNTSSLCTTQKQTQQWWTSLTNAKLLVALRLTLRPPQFHLTSLVTFRPQSQGNKIWPSDPRVPKLSINPIGYMRREQSRWGNMHSH